MYLLHELLDIVFRRIRVLAVMLGVTWLGFMGYLIVSPRIYEASARFLVKGERPPIPLIPQETPMTSLADLTDVQLATELELIASGQVLKAAAKELGDTKAISEEELQRRAEYIQKRLKVAPVLRSSLVEVRYWDNDPKRAAQVLNTVASSYLQRHMTLRGGRANYSFFEKKAEESRAGLEKAHAALAKFQTSRGIFELATQRDQAIRRLADSTAVLHDAEAREAELERRAAVLRAQIQAEQPRIPTTQRSMPDHYSVERLTTLLVDLRNKRTELSSKFRADDRTIAQLNKQIADTNAALDDALLRSSREETTDLNPLRQQAQIELARTEQALTGAKAKQAVLRQQAADYQESLRRFAASGPEEADLARRVKEAEANYLLDAKKRDALRVDALLDDQKITNVTLVEPPTVPPRPKSRFSTPLVSLFLLVNFCLIFGILLSGYLSGTVTTPWQLERLTGVPVIGTVPAFAKGSRRAIASPYVQPLAERILARGDDGGNIIWFLTVGGPGGKSKVLADIAPQLSAATGGRLLAIPSTVSAGIDEGGQFAELPMQQTASGVMEVVPVDRLQEQEDTALEYIWLGMQPEQFAHIMIETPPLDAVSPLPNGLYRAGHIFLVVTAGKSRRSDVTRAMRRLRSAGRQVSGFVLANRTYPIPEFVYRHL